MFHGRKFLENITKKSVQDQCSKYVAIDAGHWMMHQNLEAVMTEIKAFMMSSEKMM
jgi:S-adenosylmethionine:diacylglycerol 3-amino-3-carboxypropyl transferase